MMEGVNLTPVRPLQLKLYFRHFILDVFQNSVIIVKINRFDDIFQKTNQNTIHQNKYKPKILNIENQTKKTLKKIT